ncbi:hypothetical protein FRC00_013468 [Tulasnella sp. 408]|nr:hypothetical protein FRC00_013468 [Tulasnella sp. 408]
MEQAGIRWEQDEAARRRERAKLALTLKGNFRLPFDDFYDLNVQELSTKAVALVDLRMGELSYALRSKTEWWTKFKKPEIRAKWEKEALEHEIQGARLTKAEVKSVDAFVTGEVIALTGTSLRYVLDELQGYEKMRDTTTGIQQSCFQGIYESDSLISDELRNRLINAVKVLEDIPDHKKDWHPRSNKQVLDLVHPSLYCIVYGRTLAFPAGSDPANRTSADLKKLQNPHVAAIAKAGPKPVYERWSYSKEFCWMPTDFDIPVGGQPAKALSYINNIDPDLKELYSVVEGVVGRFSLMWDRVLTDLLQENEGTKYRVGGEYEWNAENAGPEPEWDGDNVEAYSAAYVEWENRRELVIPTVPEKGYTEDISHREVQYTIQGKKVQVIVKLANIILVSCYDLSYRLWPCVTPVAL